MSRNSRSQRCAILSATSALALIAGLGGNAWACTPLSGDFAFFSNTGTIDCVNFNNATVHSSVSNTSTGVIGPPSTPAPATVTVNGTTINGSLQNSGQIVGGGGTPGGILVTGGSVISNGVVNNSTGTISVRGTGGSAFGIKIRQSSFSGGITNNGVITVTNSGTAVGLQVGGGSSGPQVIQPTSGNTITTTSVTSGSGKHRHH